MWLACASAVAVATATAFSAPAAAAPSFAGLTWSRLSPASRPPGLRSAAATYDPANQTIVVFGGRTAAGVLSDQTWVWDGSTWSSSQSDGSVPPARDFASMAFDGHLDQLVLFGGRSVTGALLDDTWTWNGASWNNATTSATPGGREGAALADDSAGHLVLFGGYGVTHGVLPPPTTTTTTTTTRPAKKRTTKGHTRTTTTKTTTSPKSTTTTTTANGAATTKRRTTSTTTTTTGATTTSTSATAGPGSTSTSSTATANETAFAPGTSAATSGKAVTSGASVLDDTWLLTQSSTGVDEWLQATTTVHPPPLTQAMMSAGPDGRTLLFGGSSRGPGAGQRAAIQDGTWLWNGSTWSTVRATTRPAGRINAGIDYDALPSGLGRMVLFGGIGAKTTYGDTWSWTGKAWEQLSPASPASARSGVAAAFDASDGQLVVFGGLSHAGKVFDDTQVLTTHPPKQVRTAPNPTASTTTTLGAGGPTSTGRAAARDGSTTTAEARSVGRSSTGVRRGELITLTGSGFVPMTRITITFHSAPVTVGSLQANAEGAFSVNVEVPVVARPGSHHFEATGLGPKGVRRLATPVDVLVAATGHPVSLSVKLTLVAIAVAIPVASWFLVGAFGRSRRTPSL